jgi:DNA-binding NarL/FixJ family response regulator
MIELTSRQHEVLTGLSYGMSRREIAVELGISEETVKSHCKDLYVKMGVSDNAQAVAYGFRHGLLDVSVDGEEGQRETSGDLRLFGSKW